MNLKSYIRVFMARCIILVDKVRAFVTRREQRMHKEIAENGQTTEAAAIALEGIDLQALGVQIFVVNALQEICLITGKSLPDTILGDAYMGVIRNEVIPDELENLINKILDSTTMISRREARERVVAALLKTGDLAQHQVGFYLGTGERYENWLNEEEFRNVAKKEAA